MSLSAELARTLSRVPRPRIPRTKSALEIAADRAAEAFGGLPRELEPAKDMIAWVEKALGADGTGVRRFARRELMFVPYVIWGSDPKWRENLAFVDDYLAVVAERWPNGVRRLWRHYILNFDSSSPATVRLARWLSERRERLPAPLREYSDKYRILDVERVAATLATATLRDNLVLQHTEDVGLSIEALRGATLAVETVAAIGAQLLDKSTAANVPGKLTAFMNGSPKDFILGSRSGEELRSLALRSVVDGLVGWQERLEHRDGAAEKTLDFLLALNGDPRFSRDRWHGKVAQASIDAMERWLSKDTIEAFFRVIDTLKTDDQRMWRERRAFWLSYLPYVDKAWLVVGQMAIPLAEQQGRRFGRFSKGGGAQADHCGLILQIRGMCVMEMNKNGSAIFWTLGYAGLPGLYEESYRPRDYRAAEDDRNVFRLLHLGAWQQKFRNRIVQMTGIDVR